ncbi:MAG: hypothetical protein M1829_002168 [Trizodia sp. TS-e1964]|nr:MAG: hypothetical protein M1829_002168 [Trizodia sp. TS-e1964]
MHKFSNITGSARQGWGKMTPQTFGISRPSHDLSLARPLASNPLFPSSTPTDSTVTLSFNVPFSSSLAGPDVDDIIHATPGALERWSHPVAAPEGTPPHQLPVHVSNVEILRKLCRQISEGGLAGKKIQAVVTSSEPKSVPALACRPLKGLTTNVCLSGDADSVQKMRARILNETPLVLRCATIDVDSNLLLDMATNAVRASVIEHLDVIAKYTGTDLFLLRPKTAHTEVVGSNFNGTVDSGLDSRLRVQVYGDMESAEHAKSRVLIMIDQILKRVVDAMKLELTMHTLICGRSRKNIKLIESATNTAIYFPPPFPRVYGYTPPGAHRRKEDEVFITGHNEESIRQAKQKLHDLVTSTKCFIKDVVVSPHKIDSILLDRLDKARKIMEQNGSYILFPQIGTPRGVVRVQATEILHVERTVREIMALAGQFYSATWWMLQPDPQAASSSRAPPPLSPSDIRMMLSEICTNSGADVRFEKMAFSVNGSDDAVKAAMMVISQIPFVKQTQYRMRVKVELANEHKEFVSGKKNGKINKIMGQSNVQIIFDGFNEYNFYIDVCGAQYEATKAGLDLVEQEMPASISFHVPDQYHKRIIGIGGQHIQRIMKKYSVFVKFSNAMDRGGLGREDDDAKVDNVICRTPARNAQNLDLVKQEIMDMVEQVDSEFVQETVIINRLYHRELLARMSELEDLEKKWNCKIIFPSTEMASDIVTISGPEYQVPLAVDDFLVCNSSRPLINIKLICVRLQGMVPESHEIVLPGSTELRGHLESDEFKQDILGKLKAQYEVDMHINKDAKTWEDPANPTESLTLTYTRNNAGGLKDAIDFLTARLVTHGLDATTIKGAIPRPKSDSFEESLPFFNSKLLQNAPAPLTTESPTKPTFGDEIAERSIFDKFRKPGSISSFSSFLERRRNNANSPASFFMNGSSNGSKASIASMESQSSAYRNPWNDSGVNLPEEDQSTWPPRHFGENKFPLGPGVIMPGEMTPKYDTRASFDSGRPSTSNSMSGYPGPIGPPR